MAQKYQVEDIRGGVRLVEADSQLEAVAVAQAKGDEVLRVSLFSSLLAMLFGSGDEDYRDNGRQARTASG